MNTELRLDHTTAGSNKDGKSAKDNRFTDLAEITGHDRNNIRQQCSEHDINMLQELNMAKEGIKVFY